MLRLLVPVLLALAGLGGGVGAGLVLRPPAGETALPCAEAGADTPDHAAEETGEGPADDGGEPTHDYVKLNNQFIVPIVEGGEVHAMVILSMTLEVSPGSSEQVYLREPKIRDAFLQVLFDHANAGGFSGAFTNGNNLDVLRNALRETATQSLGPAVSDVLITDIVRQES